LGPEDTERLAALYRKEYRRLYRREGPDVPLEAITWRVEVSAPRPEIRLDGTRRRGGLPGSGEERGTRDLPAGR
jgi:N-methylhydantoinase A